MAAPDAAALFHPPSSRHPGRGAHRTICPLAAYDEVLFASGVMASGAGVWDFGWGSLVNDAGEGDVAGAVWDTGGWV